MKRVLVLGVCALSLCACGGEGQEGPTFETSDAIYELGEHVDDHGNLVNVELIEDSGSSYLTPQSPSTAWIVDRAAAHAQERPLLLNQVTPLGLYVRRCKGNAWVNVNETLFAAQSDLLVSTYDGKYFVAHYFNNIQTNVFLDDEFECPTEEPSFATITVDGEEQEVQRVGKVEFAYVIEHRE
ncbi:MAG TPA: hypothetical protein VM686_22565 [Polyangiaceae bacterium]|jgi:hypothetical protein|nr:hypothetical protein [Polyangiaceae bacterium]